MSQRRVPAESFLEDEDALVLAGIVNRMAESFNVAGLSEDEVLVIYVLLDRAMDALWRVFHRELVQFWSAVIMSAEELEEDDEEPDPSGSTSGADS